MSTINTKKGVPGIPLASLDAIQDENARQVLRAMIDGWHVRNGMLGDGDSRFVTASELGQIKGAVGGITNSLSALQAAAAGQRLTNQEIGRIINDLQASVMESQLFKELGTRIRLIGDLSNENGYKITEETTYRVNDDNAIVTAINTMWSKIGDNSSLIQRGETALANNVGAVAQAWDQVQATIKDPVTGEYISSAAVRTDAQTAVNKAGDLEAQYTVKVDVNGYVAGYGLANTATNSTPRSEFIVRADRFAIGNPDGPGIAPRVPFTVLSTTDANGNPPGVYIDNASIINLSADKITAGYLNANRIKANTITADMIISKSATYFEQITQSFSNGVASTASFYMDRWGYVSIINLLAYGFNFHSDGSFDHYLKINGVTYAAYAGSYDNTGGPISSVAMAATWLPEGWHTVTTQASHGAGTTHTTYLMILRSYR